MNKNALPEFNLKEKVLAVLAFHEHTYSQLAEYIGITEKELDSQLENNSLEIRTLELISKALRIPLYSFFREEADEVTADEELYYNVDIWGKDGIKIRTKLKRDAKGNISDKEFEKIKKAIKEKERSIQKVKKQKKK